MEKRKYVSASDSLRPGQLDNQVAKIKDFNPQDKKHKLEMEEELVIVRAIKIMLITRLQEEFGFCGVAETPELILLNSGNKTNLVIKITTE